MICLVTRSRSQMRRDSKIVLPVSFYQWPVPACFRNLMPTLVLYVCNLIIQRDYHDRLKESFCRYLTGIAHVAHTPVHVICCAAQPASGWACLSHLQCSTAVPLEAVPSLCNRIVAIHPYPRGCHPVTECSECPPPRIQYSVQSCRCPHQLAAAGA